MDFLDFYELPDDASPQLAQFPVDEGGKDSLLEVLVNSQPLGVVGYEVAALAKG